jgi:DNA-binding GntR family transcriptional regulator
VKTVHVSRDAEPSLALTAYRKLRRDIIRCKLKPGQDVSEAQLAEKYGLGKTPIREGLARLAHDGLVQALPRRGYRVSPITLADARDLLGFRVIIETEAARLAAGRCNVAQLRRLDELCSVGYDPKDAKSVERFLTANTELHATIALASGNSSLAAAVLQALDQVERLLYVALELGGSRKAWSHQHRALVDALAAGDGDGAAKAVADQISGVERMILDTAMNSASVARLNLGAPAH